MPAPAVAFAPARLSSACRARRSPAVASRRHRRDGVGGAAQAAPRPPRHRHPLGAAAALALHLRHRAAPKPRTGRRLPRLPRLSRAGGDGAGGALHRHLLRPRSDLGTRRRPVAAAACDAAAATRDRARQGDRRRHPRAHAGDRPPRRDRDRRNRDPLEVLDIVGRARPARARDRRLCVLVDDPRLARAHARALHGHRPADLDAALLRLERPLSRSRSCPRGCASSRM